MVGGGVHAYKRAGVSASFGRRRGHPPPSRCLEDRVRQVEQGLASKDVAAGHHERAVEDRTGWSVPGGWGRNPRREACFVGALTNLICL